MSRCYPYPPPGYERRPNVELGLSPKKERHKRKDKKKKRRKDSESNGDLPLDLDKRAKKAQQSGVFKDFSSANGSLPGALATPAKTVHETAAQRVQAVISNDEMPSAGVLTTNGKGIQSSSRQGSQLSLVSIKAVCNSNGATGIDATTSSSTYAKAEVKLEKASHTQYIPCVQKGWSTLDDEDWLFHEDKHLQSEPRTQIPSPQVSAEAVFLPSVGIYALPYVVPN